MSNYVTFVFDKGDTFVHCSLDTHIPVKNIPWTCFNGTDYKGSNHFGNPKFKFAVFASINELEINHRLPNVSLLIALNQCSNTVDTCCNGNDETYKGIPPIVADKNCQIKDWYVNKQKQNSNGQGKNYNKINVFLRFVQRRFLTPHVLLLRVLMIDVLDKLNLINDTEVSSLRNNRSSLLFSEQEKLLLECQTLSSASYSFSDAFSMRNLLELRSTTTDAYRNTKPIVFIFHNLTYLFCYISVVWRDFNLALPLLSHRLLSAFRSRSIPSRTAHNLCLLGDPFFFLLPKTIKDVCTLLRDINSLYFSLGDYLATLEIAIAITIRAALDEKFGSRKTVRKPEGSLVHESTVKQPDYPSSSTTAEIISTNAPIGTQSVTQSLASCLLFCANISTEIDDFRVFIRYLLDLTSARLLEQSGRCRVCRGTMHSCTAFHSESFDSSIPARILYWQRLKSLFSRLDISLGDKTKRPVFNIPLREFYTTLKTAFSAYSLNLLSLGWIRYETTIFA